MTIIDMPAKTSRTYAAPTFGPLSSIATTAGAMRVGQNNVATGAPWTLTHTPSGWVGTFDTRADLQMWLTRPAGEQVTTMRDSSRAALANQVTTTEDRRHAAMVLHVLDGHMLPHGTDQTPEAVCAGCGGYIVKTAAGEWMHVNACRYCYVPGGWTADVGQTYYRRREYTYKTQKAGDLEWRTESEDRPEWAGVCPDDYREHSMCFAPAPVDCGHILCPGVADLSGYCAADQDW